MHTCFYRTSLGTGVGECALASGLVTAWFKKKVPTRSLVKGDRPMVSLPRKGAGAKVPASDTPDVLDDEGVTGLKLTDEASCSLLVQCVGLPAGPPHRGSARMALRLRRVSALVKSFRVRQCSPQAANSTRVDQRPALSMWDRVARSGRRREASAPRCAARARPSPAG